MSITPYSFCMSLVWFSAFVFVADRLYRKTGFLLHYRMGLLLFLVGLSALRLFLPMEVGWTKTFSSYVIFPWIQDTLTTPFSVWGVYLTPLRLLMVIWFTGSLLFFLRLMEKLIRGHRYLSVLLANAVPVPAIQCCFVTVQAEAARQKPCRVSVSSSVRVPMITGILHPTILLPALATELSDQQLRHILHHEYGHVLNHDLPLKTFLEVLCCMFWWNPVVYLLKNSLGQALEVKCDLRVAKTLGEAETPAYLQTLLDVLRRVNTQKPGQQEQAVLLGSNYLGETEAVALQRRLTVVSDYASTKKNSTAVFLAVMALLFALSYSIVLQPGYHEPPASESGLGGEYLDITPENSYILRTADGEYHLYFDGKFVTVIPESELSVSPHDELKIYKE